MITNIEDVENKILGTYCQEPSLFEECEHLVSEHIFDSRIKKQIYKIIKLNHQSGIKTDFSILFNELTKLSYNKTQIIDTCKLIVFDINTSIYPAVKVKILFDALVRRKMLPVLYEAHTDFSNDRNEVQNVLDKVKNKITDIEGVINNVSKDKQIDEYFDEALQRIIDLKENKKALVGHSFGIKELDEKTGGIMQGITVIGARSAMGKTSFLVSILRKNAIEDNIPTIFFSLEMPAIEVMTNIISNTTDINSFTFRSGNTSDDDVIAIKNVKKKFKENLMIDETAGVTWQYIENKFRKMRKKIPMNQSILAFVDYIQLMTNTPDETKNKSDEQIIDLRCQQLNNVAKRYNISLVLLSQLSREVEKRSPPRPRMSDLKGSGGIEAVAVLILLLYRPEYYDKNPVDENGNSLKGVVEIGLGKSRYVTPRPVYARFDGRYSRYSDYVPEGISGGSEEKF